jgi:hypothetical protein
MATNLDNVVGYNNSKYNGNTDVDFKKAPARAQLILTTWTPAGEEELLYSPKTFMNFNKDDTLNDMYAEVIFQAEQSGENFVDIPVTLRVSLVNSAREPRVPGRNSLIKPVSKPAKGALS